MARPEKVCPGELLIRQKLIIDDQMQVAPEQQKNSGRRLGRVLIDGAFVLNV